MKRTPAQKARAARAVADLSRPIQICICKDGTISSRKRGEPSFNGRALPVFSVDTEEQVREIQGLFGIKQYVEHPLLPGRPWYRWTNFSGNVEDLDEVSEMIRKLYWENPRRVA